jgi:dTDP-4-amino-4,6-dideoxygalactose transaminase
MDAITRLAAGRGIHVIEDAAQAIGATYCGRSAGTLGDIACFSFFPSKNLGAFGDAGLVTTEDAALGARVRLLRNHGAEQKYYHHLIGGNFRLDALQAAVLRVKLPHLAAWNDGRRSNAVTYRDLFEEAGIASRVRLPVEPPGMKHIYHQYVVGVPDRDGLRAHLASRDIGTEIYYPVPFHRQECFAHFASAAGTFPNADAAAAEVLALPIFPELTRAEQQHVVSSIGEYFG